MLEELISTGRAKEQVETYEMQQTQLQKLQSNKSILPSGTCQVVQGLEEWVSACQSVLGSLQDVLFDLGAESSESGARKLEIWRRALTAEGKEEKSHPT